MASPPTVIDIPTATVTQSIPTYTPTQLTGLPLPSMLCPTPVRTCKRDRDALLRKRSEPIQFLPDGTVNVSPVTDDTFKEISRCCGSARIWTYPSLCTAFCEAEGQTLGELNACFWLPTRRGLKPGLTSVTCNGSPQDCANLNAPGNTTTIWIGSMGSVPTMEVSGTIRLETATAQASPSSSPSTGAASIQGISNVCGLIIPFLVYGLEAGFTAFS